MKDKVAFLPGGAMAPPPAQIQAQASVPVSGAQETATPAQGPPEAARTLSQESAGPSLLEAEASGGFFWRAREGLKGVAGLAGAWWGAYLSGDQNRVSTGAVLATLGFLAGLTTYIFYGLIWRANIPDNLASLTYALVAGGVSGLAITELPKLRG